MDNFIKDAQKIVDLIIESKVIIIHRHINPDGDALGSQWGIKTIINDNFPGKKILVPGEMNEHMSKLFLEADEVTPEDYEGALVIIGDTANRERISGEYWNLAKNIVKIDHHPVVDNYGTLNLIDESAVAACQLVVKWAQIMKLKISQQAAKHLFLGLVTDSGRFLYPTVTSETFQVASTLLKSGINLLEIYNSLYSQNIVSARIKGYILSNFEVTKNNVGYIIFTKNKIKKLNKQIVSKKDKFILENEHLTSQVNLMSNISGIDIWLIICQEKNKTSFKTSMRSSQIVINKVAEMFNGGGHKNAAGATLKDETEIIKLLEKLDELVINNNKI